jgi:hypothetical protein
MDLDPAMNLNLNLETIGSGHGQGQGRATRRSGIFRIGGIYLRY